ncbi:MAG TPA: PBP1A family penicillin-binding protein, partial [Gemmatimonadales bacterium]|nr:PBP1A family penicillin-binding protein [Gemmatimonadales bacterium]
CAGNACPSLEGLDDYDPAQASKVYAADGRLITDLGLERRTVVPLTQMSPAVVQAFLATEDKRFYEHDGIDWIRVLGALKGAMLGGRVTGASTITMQLARNLFPEDISGRDRSMGRKLREAHVALEIEDKFEKDKILELYLNQIDLGNRAYGVEVASQRYFGKSSGELNLAEAATLAAIPKAPNTYNPRRSPARSVGRRNLVLELMQEQGIIAGEEAERWKAYPLLLSSRSDFTGVADYFVEYVRQQLQARFGEQLYRGGLRIYTTLDLEMQFAAERALEAQLTAIEAGGPRYGKYPHLSYAKYLDQREDGEEAANRAPYLQGLMLTLDAKTGEIRAMVGGRDFEDSKFNRVTQSRRQPGSTFKPITFTAALEAGHTLSEPIVDDTFSLSVPDQPLWTPQNYDLKFEGNMTLRRALFESRNIPLIKLGMAVGEQTVIDEARRFGISTSVRPVPSIHIGSADVVPMEMIAAFTAFANLGVRTVPQAILRVEDRGGRILWQPTPKRVQVVEPAIAWLVTDVLRDVVRRGTASGTVGSQINFPAAGKTGTTNDGFDVWFIGFTPELVTGVWMGFDQPKKIMPNAQGGRLAAPAWTAMMREVYDRRPSPGGWPRPNDLVVAEVDSSTGGLATPFCPREYRYVESYAPATAPQHYCPAHSQLLGIPGMTPGGAAPAPAGATTVPAAPGRALPSSGSGVMGGQGPPTPR